MDQISTGAMLGLLDRLLPQGRLRTGAALFTLGFLLAKSCACCAAVHKRRSQERTSTKAPNVQRWEGEGGRTEEPAVGGGITE